jgi:hypothetical protein
MTYARTNGASRYPQPAQNSNSVKRMASSCRRHTVVGMITILCAFLHNQDRSLTRSG